MSTNRISIRPTRVISERVSTVRPVEKVTSVSRPSCHCVGQPVRGTSCTSVTEVHTCPLCNTRVTRKSARPVPSIHRSRASVTSINMKENRAMTGTFGSPNVKQSYRVSARNSNQNQRKIISTRKRLIFCKIEFFKMINFFDKWCEIETQLCPITIIQH